MKYVRLLSTRPQSFVPMSLLVVLASVAFLAGFLLSGGREATAQAVPSRIGVVDFQKILRESVPGKASIAKISAVQNDRLAKAKQMTDEMQKLETDLRNPALPPAQRGTIQQRLTEKQVAMKRFAEDADKELGTLRDRELQGLQARMRPVIDSVGREMGMAAIFNKYESGLVYANDAIDVTNTVITRFNTSAPAPTTPATTATPRPGTTRP